MSSIELLLATVQSERDRQLSHFDALDTKAGVVLGFAGALVALTPNVSLVARTSAIALALASAGTAS